MSVDGNLLFFLAILAAFIIVDGLLIWAYLVEQNKINTCKTQQSKFCPTIICNDPTASNFTGEITTEGLACAGYAYRFTDTNGGYECNFPFEAYE